MVAKTHHPMFCLWPLNRPACLSTIQAECLHSDNVLGGGNLVYCAPTSGGKSLVAEVLMLRRLHRSGRPFLMVLPYVSLCDEKRAHLERLLAPLQVIRPACRLLCPARLPSTSPVRRICREPGSVAYGPWNGTPRAFTRELT